MTSSTAAPFIERVSTHFLWRVAGSESAYQAAAVAELERRDLVEQRRAYFSCAAPTIAVNARDLTVGNVITDGPGYVRMVVRDVHRLRGSDRVLVTFSYTNLATYEVEAEKHELPVMAGDREVRMVRESVPGFAMPAVAR